ncbi:MAG TPA: right-handed parallel beta-helix repeat-containing protein [Sedimentisphaerales bacterium]|nr:right-handed parallel beta-helix repeat-containing protein [Sedimentisphaerales bacterium]
MQVTRPLRAGWFASLVPIVLLAGLPAITLHAATFYVDPVIGDPNNDGSYESPWRTLQEVFDNDLIETRVYETTPYSPNTPLITRNPGAPVKAGDTILLRSGYHGAVWFRGGFNADYITIAAQEGHTPYLKKVQLSAVSKWILRGLTISPEFAPPLEKTILIFIESHAYHGASYNVIIENNNVFTVQDSSTWDANDWNTLSSTGIRVDGPNSIIRNNTLKNVDFGIVIEGANTLAEYNTIERLAGDGITGGADNITLQFNLIKNFYRVNNNHGDGIQFHRGLNPDRIPMKNCVLRGNVIISNDPEVDSPLIHSPQGIGCFDPGMYIDWLVENNIVLVQHFHGIAIFGGENCVIVNNITCDPTGKYLAWISLGETGKNTVVRNNLSRYFDLAGENITIDHNIDIDDYGPDALFIDYQNHDLRHKVGSPAIDAASADLAPGIDIDLKSRPLGPGYDIGAYEFAAVYVSASSPNDPGSGTQQDPYRHLQDGIDAAQKGYLVPVAAGTYNESITISDDICLWGGYDPNGWEAPTDPNVYKTIIDANGLNDSAVHFINAKAVIGGFTITNGLAENGGGIYCRDSSPKIKNCTITGNSTVAGLDSLEVPTPGADGAGIYCRSSAPLIKNCIITNNTTGRGGKGQAGANGGNGAGVYCTDSRPVIVNCVVRGNHTGNGGFGQNTGGAGGSGAGIYCDSSTDATIINCTITANITGNGAVGPYNLSGDGGDGAGIYGCLGKIRNCKIVANKTGCGALAPTLPDRRAGNGGSGAGVFASSSLTIANCTIVNNTTGIDGTGGVWGIVGLQGDGAGICADDATIITNTIVWKNSPDQLAGQDCNNVTYCDIYDGACSGQIGTISFDPLFVDPNGPDGDPNTWQDNDYRLLSISPCIDAGDPSSDYSNEPQPNGNRINMGVCGNSTQATISTLDFDGDGITNPWEIYWRLNPHSSDTDSDGLSDDYEVCYDGDCNTYHPYDPCTGAGADLNADSNDTDADGMPDDWELLYTGCLGPLNKNDAGSDCDGDGYTNLQEYTRGSLPDSADSLPQPLIFYVDDDANGLSDGLSWPDAYNYLQDALSVALRGDQVWVAGGVYRPDEGRGLTKGDRRMSFMLKEGVPLRGGFAGVTAPDPNDRNFTLYETTLSGDLNGDDEPNFANNTENSCHVVTAGGVDFTAVLEGFTITAGNANSPDPNYTCGGGIYNISARPIIADCIISYNHAQDKGAGIRNYYSSPILLNCTLSGNHAGITGGAVFNEGSVPTLTNCTFSGNMAPDGNALACDSYQQLYPSDVEITNCILWDGGNELSNKDASIISISYSCIRNWTEGGTGNIADDPCFADPNNDDYHLRSEAGRWDPVAQSWVLDTVTSPCIDAGDPNSDWTGELWPHGSLINMGAYGGTPEASLSVVVFMVNFQPAGSPVPPGYEVDSGDLYGNRSSGLTYGWNQANYATRDRQANPDQWYDTMNHLQKSGNRTWEIELANGTYSVYLLCGDPAATDQINTMNIEGTVAPDPDGQNHFDEYSVDVDAIDGRLTVKPAADPVNSKVCFIEITGQIERSLYVDNDAPGDPEPNNPHVSDPDEDGSLDHPFDMIGEAIDYAVDGDVIIVLEGIYYENICYNGKNIILTGIDPCNSEIVSNTIIDGNSNGSVVTFANGEDPNCLITGFTITNGYAVDGGGIYCSNSSPTIGNCVITRNIAENLQSDSYGGGMYNDAGNPTLTNCTFSGNLLGADYSSGGGMYNRGGNPTLTNCTFSENAADASDEAYGGGVCNDSGSLTLTNCTFKGNSTHSDQASPGGGMHNAGQAALIGCEFAGNISFCGQAYADGAGFYNCGIAEMTGCRLKANQSYATTYSFGGGVYNEGSMCLSNCLLVGNSINLGDGGYGGGVYNTGSMTLANCTLSENSVNGDYKLYGGGICTYGSTTVNNCILWANSDMDGMVESSQIRVRAGSPVVNYNCIHGWTGSFGGIGNMGDDPCFADPCNGDFHLLSEAGRWDPNIEEWVYDGVTSPCIDAGDPNDPNWMNELWPHGRQINMGAYGGTPEASMSLSTVGNIADLNNDGVVDWRDLYCMCGCWCAEQKLLAADLDRNGLVALGDFAIFAENWCVSVEEGLVGYWKFEDGNGTTALDSSGHQNTGSLIGGPVWTSSRFNGALRFDGIDDAVEIGAGELDANCGTISLWAYPEGFSATPHYLFGHTLTTDPWSDRIQLYAGDQSGNLTLGLGDSHFLHTNIQTLEIHKWYHICLTWNENAYVVYVNGTPKANGSYAGLSALASFADIGNDGSTKYRNESFNGVIDEVRVYNRALGAGEISELWASAQAKLDELVPGALDFSQNQLADTVASITTTEYPMYTVSYSSWYITGANRWSSGFFPGCLWRMYELNSDPNYRNWAESWTAGLEGQATANPTQDLVFMIYNTFGTGYRLTANAAYKNVVLQAAQTVAEQCYNPNIGAIVAGWGSFKYSVNIDSMMTTELLFWASKNGGQAGWYDMALSHAYRTRQDHVRPDGSTYQYVDYDANTGDLISRSAWQGYSVESTWSRGQAWAIYGFTVAYRQTGDANFLETAKKAADYFIDNLPADSVPYWDFNAPGIPDTEKDTSAAAVAASGLFELSTLVGDPASRQKYYDAACRILVSLCTIEPYGGYLAEDKNGNRLSSGILLHGCYHHHDAAAPGSVFDESLVWGDYYLVEALLRYRLITAH